MSQHFWQKVRKFFNLLDANHDGTIDVPDARSRMVKVLTAIHRQQREQMRAVDEIDGKDSEENEEERLQQEVNSALQMLFDAADFRHDQHITVDEFETMYRNLLKAQYEPEVLELDLDRAIQVLEGDSENPSASSMHGRPLPNAD